MGLYRCTVRCQWRRQLWKIGETVECGGGEAPPSAFFEEIMPDAPEIEGSQSQEHTDELATRRRGGRRKKEEDGNDGSGGSEPGADTAGG